MKGIIRGLKEYNSYYFQNSSMGDINNPNIYDFENKNSIICLTAPHSTKTFREGRIKQCDLYTGCICKYLGEVNDVSTIIRNKFTQDEELGHLASYIIDNKLENHLFLDIHGMSEKVDFQLAIGTGYFMDKETSNILLIIIALAEKYDISYVVDHPEYTGMPGLTGVLQQQISKFNIIQLEWRKDMRDFYNNPELAGKTVSFMSELISKLKN